MIKIIEDLSDEEYTTKFGKEGMCIKSKIQRMVSTQVLWLKRLKGISLKEFPNYSDKSRQELITKWKECNKELAFYYKDDIIETVNYTTTKGQKFVNLKDDILLHIVMFTHFYIGQITYILEALGKNFNTYDYIHYRRMDQLA